MKKQQTVTTAISPRQVVAQARLRAASEHIEAAQHELERAVSALVSLNWMQPEQIRVSKLRDRVHAMFYRLSAFSYARAKACAKATLDREVEAGDEDGHRAAGTPGAGATSRSCAMAVTITSGLARITARSAAPTAWSAAPRELHEDRSGSTISPGTVC